MVACKHTPSWTHWGFLIALGIPHCIPARLVASESLVCEIKTNQSLWIFFMMLLFHNGNTNKINIDDDLLHTDKKQKNRTKKTKTHSPVVSLLLDLMMLNINNLMILIHAVLAWWSRGRRWGQSARWKLPTKGCSEKLVTALWVRGDPMGRESRNGEVRGIALCKIKHSWVTRLNDIARYVIMA